MMLVDVLEGFGALVLGYFALLSLIYLGFTVVAWQQLTRYRRNRAHALTDETFRSPLTPPVSVLLPAYNEEAGIVDSVRSLLQLRFPEHEVVVVDDGSTDATLDRLIEAFDLVPVRRVLRGGLDTAPIRATYASRRHPELWVVAKDNGGKADALNCGINASQYPYVCSVDADALLEPDALLRVMEPVVNDPDRVIATGGIIRIANGCVVDDGRVTEVRLPRSRLATLQVVEYFRAFLVGRVGWSRMNALLIISGAFGLFKRSALVDAGGYTVGTVGEDVELVVRLHRRMRDTGRDYRIVFVPDPVCWTEAPESLDVLGRQRRRWQRGLGETLAAHRRAIGNRRYGAFGLLAMPYFLVFELIGPIIELTGYLVIPLAWATGLLSPVYVTGFLFLSIATGTLLSVSALALEELSFRRHRDSSEVARMILYAMWDNLGYRQLTNFWRILGMIDLARGEQGWGEMRRKGFRSSEPGVEAGDHRRSEPTVQQAAAEAPGGSDPVSSR